MSLWRNITSFVLDVLTPPPPPPQQQPPPPEKRTVEHSSFAGFDHHPYYSDIVIILCVWLTFVALIVAWRMSAAVVNAVSAVRDLLVASVRALLAAIILAVIWRFVASEELRALSSHFAHQLVRDVRITPIIDYWSQRTADCYRIAQTLLGDKYAQNLSDSATQGK